MKKNTAVLITVFSIIFGVSYAKADAQQVTCTGEIPGTESVTLTAQLTAEGAKYSAYKFQNLSDPTQDPWANDSVNPAETDELFIGYARFNYFFGHHNTLITVTADGDVFGYANVGETAENNSGYRGKLVLWSGPGDNPQRKIFDVICKNK
jgi:hypothetical protein